ncbi:MAG: metal ABC transporter permease [Simkaniaceae bacterium]|nr:metal ABC transporter permease [Simkaniaceae bacterium]
MTNLLLPFTSFFSALATNFFLQTALFASLSATVASGVIGSYVVSKRIVFISGSIAHSVIGGMGLFLYLKRIYGLDFLEPVYGALFAGIISALLIGWIHIKYKEREDTVIASIWAFGMSVGVILVTLTPGYNVELLNYLFGSLLWASKSDIATLFMLDAAVLLFALIFHRQLLAICFDEKQAKLQGLKVNALYFSLLIMIAITVVLLIQIVGAILVIAFLTLPAAIANTFTQKLSKMMGFAIIIGIIIALIGIFLSYTLNWPPGATISLCATIFYILNLIRKKQSVKSTIVP